MFNKKQDNYLVNMSIEFNIDKINDFIKQNGKITDESLTKEDEETDWDDTSIKKTYYIDILPNGNNDIFFHRTKNSFSHRISAQDYFVNSDENVKKYIKNTEIRGFYWERWHEFLSIAVFSKKNKWKRNPIILVPIHEIGLLMMNGKLEELKSDVITKEKFKVPISFELTESNIKPKELIEIWRSRSILGNWISYRNALVTVEASVPTVFEEQY